MMCMDGSCVDELSNAVSNNGFGLVERWVNSGVARWCG